MQKKTAEKYLKTILRLEEQRGTVRSSLIAEEMLVTRPTVCVTLRELSLSGYILMHESHEITLTEHGREVAQAVTERYRFFRELLLGMGLPQDIAEQDACAMENALSEESYEAFRESCSKKAG